MGKKKVRPNGLVLRGGTYYFRLDLPKDVRPVLGRTAVWESLETGDFDAAVAGWAPKHSKWKDRIKAVRSGTLRNIDDRAAWDIGGVLIERVEHDSPSRYLHPAEPLTLPGIADMVQDDLERQETVYGDDGFQYRLAELTKADRLAVVGAVQERLFVHINSKSLVLHKQAAAVSDEARAIKPSNVVAGSAVVRLMDAFDTWKAAAQPRQKTEHEFESACRDFIKVNGDLPLVDFTENHFVAYKSYLNTVKSERTGKPLAQMTRNKRMGGVKAVVQAAVDNRDLKVHPGANVVVAKGAKSKLRIDGLFDEEIETLFTSPVFTEGERPKGIGEAAYWVPVLAFFTGARQSELCQLMVADVVKRDGIVCLRVTDDEEEGQHVKTEGSVRLVPLADRVIELGFMKYVATLNQKGKLFPEVKADVHGVAGGLFSKWYGKYRREIGLDRKGADFHAIRHLAKTALRGTAGDGEAKLEITGHSSGTVSSGYGRISVKDMKKIVDQIAYEVVIPKWKPAKKAA